MIKHLTVVMICAFAFAGTANAGQPLAQHLPADSLAYVGWAGTQSLPFDGSMFGQLLKEPALVDIMNTVIDAAKGEMPDDQSRALLGHGIALGTTVWQSPAAIAWLDLQAGDQGPDPSIALLIDLGDKMGVKAFSDHLEPLLEAVEDKLNFTTASVGSVSYRTCRPEEDGPELSLGYIGNVFFVAVGQAAPGKIIGLDPAKSLKTNKTFNQHMAQVSGNNEQSCFYVDIMAIRKAVEPLINAELAEETQLTLSQIVDALGLGGATVMAGATRIVDKGMYSRSKLFSPRPHRGLLMLQAGSGLNEQALADVPADADYVCAMSISPVKLYTEVRRVIKALDPETDVQIQQGLSAAEDALGIKLETDLLATLGDTFVLSSASSQGGFLTGTVVTVEVKDSEAFAVTLAKIEAFASQMLAGPGSDVTKTPVAIETVKADRTEIHYMRISQGPIPVAPAWALHKDKLYIALWPQVIQTTIENAGRDSLIEQEAFKKLRARVGKMPSQIAYTNTPQIVRKFYGLAILAWTAGANAAHSETPFGLKPEGWPALSRLEKYLWPHIAATSAEADGILSEEYGSIPLADLIANPAPVALVGLPALAKARNQAKKSLSMSKLRSLGTGMMFYYEDYGEFPSSWATMHLDDYGMTTEMLVSPISGRKPPKIVDGKLVGKSDYIFVKLSKKLRKEPPAEAIVAYERLENYKNKGTLVLFTDSHVEWMERAEFEKALKRTEDLNAEKEVEDTDF